MKLSIDSFRGMPTLPGIIPEGRREGGREGKEAFSERAKVGLMIIHPGAHPPRLSLSPSLPPSLPPFLPCSLPAAVREREEEEAEMVPMVSLPSDAADTGRGREGGRES
jgi:hypothetical protein